MFEYARKGNDRLTIYLEATNEAVCDEVKHYQKCRYIVEPKVVYTLLEYDIVDSKQTEEGLKVHFTDIKQVYFREELEKEAENRQKMKPNLLYVLLQNESFQTKDILNMNSLPSVSGGPGHRKNGCPGGL